MRTLADARNAGHPGAVLAFEVFCYRLAKSLAAMSCALPQLDGLVFTGGIGENSSAVRERTLEHLKLFGFKRSEEHTSELQSSMRSSYAVFCLQKKKTNTLTSDSHT